MPKSIKISDAEMLYLRKEAKVSSRSIAGQVEHWLRIGRAIESSSLFNYQRVKQALASLNGPDDLNLEEQEVYFEQFAQDMGSGTREQKAYFEKRRRAGLGVGLNEAGVMTHQTKAK